MLNCIFWITVMQRPLFAIQPALKETNQQFFLTEFHIVEMKTACKQHFMLTLMVFSVLVIVSDWRGNFFPKWKDKEYYLTGKRPNWLWVTKLWSWTWHYVSKIYDLNSKSWWFSLFTVCAPFNSTLLELRFQIPNPLALHIMNMNKKMHISLRVLNCKHIQGEFTQWRVLTVYPHGHASLKSSRACWVLRSTRQPPCVVRASCPDSVRESGVDLH